jgi:hypothetical protein
MFFTVIGIYKDSIETEINTDSFVDWINAANPDAAAEQSKKERQSTNIEVIAILVGKHVDVSGT